MFGMHLKQHFTDTEERRVLSVGEECAHRPREFPPESPALVQPGSARVSVRHGPEVREQRQLPERLTANVLDVPES